MHVRLNRGDKWLGHAAVAHGMIHSGCMVHHMHKHIWIAPLPALVTNLQICGLTHTRIDRTVDFDSGTGPFVAHCTICGHPQICNEIAN